MQCYHCLEEIVNKPWNHLTNIVDKDKEINEDKYICSYVCYKRLSENNKLPKNLWHHIVNKNDYIDNINPVLPKEKDFQYLTHEEISEMNDKEKEIYFTRKDSQIEYDSKLTEFREENEREDKRTTEYENNFSELDGSNGSNDDY